MFQFKLTSLTIYVMVAFAIVTNGEGTTPTSKTPTTTEDRISTVEKGNYPAHPEIEIEYTYANLTEAEIADFQNANPAPKTFRNVQNLDKRSDRPDVCWSFVEGLGHTRSQYFRDLEYLRADLAGSSNFRTVYTMSTVTISLGYAKVIIQNTDTCAVNVVGDSTVAYYIKQFQDFCTDHKGWMFRKDVKFIHFQVDQNGQPPPAYSPRCNYY